MNLIDLWGPLPWHVKYISLERPEHYLERLCAANGLELERLRQQIEYHHGRGQARNPEVVGPLAERIGGLADGRIARDREWAQPTPGEYPVRFACLFCSAGASIPQVGHIRSFVCTRHGRWLGIDAVDNQSVVGRPRDVMRSERRWRRAVRSGRIDPRIFRRALQAFWDAELASAESDAGGVGGVAEAAARPLRCEDWPEIVRIALMLTDDRLGETAAGGGPRLRLRLVEIGSDYGATNAVIIDHLCEEVRRLAALEGREMIASVLKPHPDNPHYGEMLRRRPDLLSAWDYSANPGIDPFILTTGGSTPLTWKCERGHTWRARVTQRLRTRTGCAWCAGFVLIPAVNDLATTFPDLGVEWDEDANGVLTPQSIRSNSARVVGWRCIVCDTRWSAQVRYRIKGQANCPQCTAKRTQRDLRAGSRVGDLPEPLRSEWCGGAGAGATTERIHASKRYEWRCRLGHHWEAVLRNRLAGTGCPYCANQKVLPGFNDFASRRPERLRLWASTVLGPDQVTVRSNRLVPWRCHCGHEWTASVDTVMRAVEPCSRCRHADIFEPMAHGGAGAEGN